MQLDLSIGDVRLRIRDAERDWRFPPGDPHAPITLPAAAEPDLDLRVRRGPLPALPEGPAVYTTEGGLWNLHRDASDLLFALGAPAEGGALHRVARVDEAVTRGEVVIGPAGDRPGFHPYPLRYPLDELLLINHLARGRGAVIHACGVRRGAAGWLFVGKSGAGKSTLAKLWAGQASTAVLSDDRVIVRPSPEGFRMYGTPWHGDAGFSSPLSAPLERIFLLAHGARNRITPAGPEEAAEALLVNCFAPFYDRKGMEFTLDLIGSLIARVPVARLEFTPDRSAIEAIEEDAR